MIIQKLIEACVVFTNLCEGRVMRIKNLSSHRVSSQKVADVILKHFLRQNGWGVLVLFASLGSI